mgnify:CR=1 FL=1
MPLRPTSQGFGSTLGKRLFGTSSRSVIQRKLQVAAKGGALQSALKAQGVKGGMTARKLTQILTGDAAGTSSMHDLKGAVEALQSMGVTAENDTKVGTILSETTKRAQQDEQVKLTGNLRPNALAMAGSQASLNARIAANRLAREGGEVSEKPLEQARSIKEIRETLRNLGINPQKNRPRPGFGKSSEPTS